MKSKFLALILAALCAATSSVCFTACNTNDDGKGSDNTENTQPEITELQEYDLSGISFNDKSITYDGNFHSIEIVGDLPQGVSVSYTGGGTNAGEYTVTAKFAGDTVTHKPIADITAKLTIIKAPFMGEISFSGAQFDYDGEAHNITLTGDLPEGIFVSYEYKNEAGETVAPENVKEIGEYTVTAVFTSENYKPISSLTAVLKIVGQTLYDAQGNMKAIFCETIVDWLNKTNYYGNLISRGTNITLNKIDYFNVDRVNKSIEFGVYNIVTYSDGSKTKRHTTLVTYYQEFAEKVLNCDFKSVYELKKYLNDNYSNYPFNSSSANAIHEISTFDEDITAQEKSDLFTMAENILKRLQEVGYQGASINNEGTKVTDYDEATILSVRKDKDTGGNSSLNMGTIYHSNIYVTIEKENGNQEILTFGVSYSTSGASQNIIDEDIKSKSWIIREYSSKVIDFCPYA